MMFDELKNMGNLGELMNAARQVQERMRGLQEELAKKTVTAEAGGGLVQATVNGRLELVKLAIDRSHPQAQDLELLEDVIVAAVNAAHARASEMAREEMQKLAAGAGIPPGMMP